MTLLPQVYIETLRTRDFFLLTLIMFFFNMTTVFILLILIVNAYEKTGSSFAISGVYLSFSLPGIFLTVLAGVTADLFDRRKIIVITNLILVLVILLLLFTFNKFYISILLAFLYFGINVFFLPAASAATTQLVGKSRLLVANSIFTFTLAAGQIVGFLVAAIIIFFLGIVWTLIVCELLTIALVWLATLMPPLFPRQTNSVSVMRTMKTIGSTLFAIFKGKVAWFFFLMFGFMQGLVTAAITLGPGFFERVVGLSIQKSLLLVFPIAVVGAAIGAVVTHKPKREKYLVSAGLGMIGVSSLLLGMILNFGLFGGIYLLIPVGLFIISLGFGFVVTMTVSRTALQKRIVHNVQGSVFGAAGVVTALFSAVMSPLAAGLEALSGYNNLLVYGGITFTLFSLLLLTFIQDGNFKPDS